MAAGLEFSCPSCGAPHDIRNPGVVMAVCEYCGNAVVWNQQAIEDAGKQATLPEGFSRLYRGALGWLHKQRFEVLGRVRYSFGHGFWDEWFLGFDDGSSRWLSEDNHEFALQTRLDDVSLQPYHAYRPGSLLSVNGTQFVVQEVGNATCLGVEGALPKEIHADESYRYVDASSPEGRYTLGLEYDEGDSPTVFHGRWLKPAELSLDDEGGDW